MATFFPIIDSSTEFKPGKTFKLYLERTFWRVGGGETVPLTTKQLPWENETIIFSGFFFCLRIQMRCLQDVRFAAQICSRAPNKHADPSNPIVISGMRGLSLKAPFLVISKIASLQVRFFLNYRAPP